MYGHLDSKLSHSFQCTLCHIDPHIEKSCHFFDCKSHMLFLGCNSEYLVLVTWMVGVVLVGGGNPDQGNKAITE